MCKWIKDILFPTNVLGKKRKSLTFDIPAYPPMPVTLTIVWSGELLKLAYTNLVSWRYGYNGDYPIVVSRKGQFKDGNSTTVTFNVKQGADGYETQTVANQRVYISCTNVTSLVVNGQTLI